MSTRVVLLPRELFLYFMWVLILKLSKSLLTKLGLVFEGTQFVLSIRKHRGKIQDC